MRILITGSRDWDDMEIVRAAILSNIDDHRRPDPFKPITVVLVHGANPRGADYFADVIAADHLLDLERHPADWERYGKRAGYVRNAEMVKQGADVCLAFIKDQSRGATMCADLAEKAGIPTVRICK